MARRRRVTVSAFAARPLRANEPAINSSALSTISLSLAVGPPARLRGGHGGGGPKKSDTASGRMVRGGGGGFPIASRSPLVLEKKDPVNGPAEMPASTEGFAPKPVTRLRPGHADLAGALKYGHTDVRNVLERSSARETATRVAAGGVARKLLGQFGVEILSFTQSIGRTDIGFEGV